MSDSPSRRAALADIEQALTDEVLLEALDNYVYSSTPSEDVSKLRADIMDALAPLLSAPPRPLDPTLAEEWRRIARNYEMTALNTNGVAHADAAARCAVLRSCAAALTSVPPADTRLPFGRAIELRHMMLAGTASDIDKALLDEATRVLSVRGYQSKLFQPFAVPPAEAIATGDGFERVLQFYDRGPGDPPGNSYVLRCPECNRYEHEGHADVCSRKVAAAPAEAAARETPDTTIHELLDEAERVLEPLDKELKLNVSRPTPAREER